MLGSEETFANSVNSVLTEYAQTKVTDITTAEEDEDDPIKVEVRGLTARITSIKCSGDERINLIKFFQASSTITTKRLDSKSCPFFSKGLKIEISTANVNPLPVSSAPYDLFQLMMRLA